MRLFFFSPSMLSAAGVGALQVVVLQTPTGASANDFPLCPRTSNTGFSLSAPAAPAPPPARVMTEELISPRFMTPWLVLVSNLMKPLEEDVGAKIDEWSARH